MPDGERRVQKVFGQSHEIDLYSMGFLAWWSVCLFPRTESPFQFWGFNVPCLWVCWSVVPIRRFGVHLKWKRKGHLTSRIHREAKLLALMGKIDFRGPSSIPNRKKGQKSYRMAHWDVYFWRACFMTSRPPIGLLCTVLAITCIGVCNLFAGHACSPTHRCYSWETLWWQKIEGRSSFPSLIQSFSSLLAATAQFLGLLSLSLSLSLSVSFLLLSHSCNMRRRTDSLKRVRNRLQGRSE